MTRISNTSDDNVTVGNFGQNNPEENRVNAWYNELLEANSRALYFRGLLIKRLQHISSKLKVDEVVVDRLLEFHRFNYSLWKDEVVRLNSLIQSHNVAMIYRVVNKNDS